MTAIYSGAHVAKPLAILAIDPGLEGAWALYWPETHNLKTCAMPTMGEGAKREVNCAFLAASIRSFRISTAVIERVHAMPKQGVSSTFRFGQAYGAARACVQAWAIPLINVEPQVWKRFHGLKNAGKEASRQKAVEIFPAFSQQFSRVKDHNRAEAALIALWAARRHEVVARYKIREAAE